MEISTEAPDVKSELQQRQNAAAKTVLALLVGVVLLCVLAFFSKRFLVEQNNPSLDIMVRITILIFGLGAVALRRTRFATLRLQDIASLKGTSGLLITLQRTTIHVALLGATIEVVGFIATLLTGNAFYSYGAGLVSIAVLLYCYPTRRQWERAVQRFSPNQNAP